MKNVNFANFEIALLSQIAHNINSVKKALETEESSKEVTRLQGMLKGYWVFYRNLAILKFGSENEEDIHDEIKVLSEYPPENLISINNETRLINWKDDESLNTLSDLQEDMLENFTEIFGDNLEKMIFGYIDDLGRNLLLYDTAPRDLYFAQGEKNALVFFQSFIDLVNEARQTIEYKQKKEAEEMALFQ